MNSQEGQLFEDLAFTMMSALIASLFAALFLVPTLAHHLLKCNIEAEPVEKDILLAAIFTLPSVTPMLRNSVLVLGVPIALIVSFLALPSIDVLPSPKERLVLVSVQFNEVLSMK